MTITDIKSLKTAVHSIDCSPEGHPKVSLKFQQSVDFRGIIAWESKCLCPAGTRLMDQIHKNQFYLQLNNLGLFQSIVKKSSSNLILSGRYKNQMEKINSTISA